MGSVRRKSLSLAGSALVLPLVLFAAAVAPASAASAAPPAPESAQVALDWNFNAVTAVRAARTMDGVPVGLPPRPFYQPEGLVYMSYVQAAVYDAVMKISHRYQLYHHFSVGAGNASPESAVISASYNTLVFYLGDPGGVLATKYAASIAALPRDSRTARGIAVGEAAAADIEQLRAGDGRNAPVSDACPTASVPPTPGAWLCNPDGAPPQFEVTPWLAGMKPFLLESSSQFRAPAPPALDSALYKANFDETKAYGDKNSTVRSADDTVVAWFWFGNVIEQFNATLRGVAIQHNLDLVDTVRLLVMGVMVPADALINCFESKYHYLFWRPITAIRADGNLADASWTPLAGTPNHPEYPSAHGCATSALGSVLADVLATTSFNVTMPGGQNGSPALTTTRTYATEADLDSELVNARVWIGYHFRNSVLRGEDLGHSAAAWSLQRFFLPQDQEGGE